MEDVDAVRNQSNFGNTHFIVLLDIALPRDIDPAAAQLEDVYLFDIDDLKQVIAKNRAKNRSPWIIIDTSQNEKGATLHGIAPLFNPPTGRRTSSRRRGLRRDAEILSAES